MFEQQKGRPEKSQTRKRQGVSLQKKSKSNLPDDLQSSMEALSGYSLDDVNVHYNSSKPAQLNAHAYAQGSDIHIGPNQERHLPHEAWHVVQQKQGRVKPTVQYNGVQINDDEKLEQEADEMGRRSQIQMKVKSLISIGLSNDPHLLKVANSTSGKNQIGTQLVEDVQETSGLFIVPDGDKTSKGQLSKSDFLRQLQGKVTNVADMELSKIGQTADSCPYIKYWFTYYNGLRASQIQRAIHLYAPSTKGVSNADSAIKLILERVQMGLQEQIATGSIDPVDSGDPSSLKDRGVSLPNLTPPDKAEIGEVAQLGKKAKKIDRPAFIGSIKAMREDAKYLYPGENIHMAHRLSWQSIRDTLLSGKTTVINTMIRNLCIPQRDFGDPASGGVAMGNTEFYDAIQKLFKRNSDVEVLAKALNSSPYNLRPGDGPTNSAIGGEPDAHRDETLPGEPMTPQSSALLPPTTTNSSDFMTMGSFAIWEANFYTEYVLPAIASVNRIK